jgi:hypothetical protein
MNLREEIKGWRRHLDELAGRSDDADLTPRARFFLLLVPRILAGRCTASRLAGHGIALIESGNQRLGTWCWERAIRSSVHDERTCGALIDRCIEAKHHERAAELANALYDRSGFVPSDGIRLTGPPVLGEGPASALRNLDR